MTPENNIIEKIKKLLALSESSNEAEVASAAAKAHELLRSYNLALSDLDKATASLVELRGHIAMSKLQDWRQMLAGYIASVNYCSAIRTKKNGYEVLCFVGRIHNIVAVTTMFDYLEQVVKRLSRQLSDKRLNRESYRNGIVEGLGQRIKSLATAEDESCKALVVLDTEVRDFLKSLKTTTREIDLHGDSKAFQKGLTDSKTISLNRQLAGGVA